MRNSICMFNDDNDYDYDDYGEDDDKDNLTKTMMKKSKADNLIPRLVCAPKYATTPREASNALVKRVMSRSMH